VTFASAPGVQLLRDLLARGARLAELLHGEVRS
jgi:hypothetical protein